MPEILLILAGGLLSVASAMATGWLIAPRMALPVAVRFTTGAAVYSLAILALLACHAGYLGSYVALGAVLIFAAWRRSPALTSLPRLTWFYRAVFAIYGAMYFLAALAPEIQEDAAGYHLRIVSDFVKLHQLSGRVSFYDVMPHGLEMLFVPAFAIGAHSSAKLISFAFLVAAVPLIREMARELNFADNVACCAAALVFLSPVAGVAGTSAYTDLALVCACCSTLYLLLRWRRERVMALLICAALNAGFCYAVKQNFGWLAVVSFVYIAVCARAFVPAGLFAGTAFAVMAPWLVRAWWLTGNPFAPFLNAWIHNASFTAAAERQLFDSLSALRAGFSWAGALADYTVRGGNQGLLGPAFVLLPLALFALRSRAGRWLLGSSALLAVPFLSNTGTRFLMPALAPASIAMASVIPGPALPVLVAIQAIGSWPAVLNFYQHRPEWRLTDVPLEAALRIVPERDYLERVLPRYRAARMILRNTGGDSKVFACTPLPESYIARDILFYWQSALALRFTDALHFAAISHGTAGSLLSLRWEHNRYRALRMRALSQVRVVEISGFLQPGWEVREPGAMVGIPMKRGAAGADLLVWPAGIGQAEMEASDRAGHWGPVDASFHRYSVNVDVRRDATAYMRRQGYRYLSIPAAGDAFAEVGADMAKDPEAWGVREIAAEGSLALFEITD